jgi:hypothetical protein
MPTAVLTYAAYGAYFVCFQEEDAMKSTMTTTRRGALGAVLAAGAAAATALPASTLGAALPAAALVVSTPTMATPAAQPPAASAPTQEAEGLMEIGRRMPELLDEFWKARTALKDARARFDESAPLLPKRRKRPNDAKRLFKEPMFKIVRGTPAPQGDLPWEVSASHTYETLWDACLRGRGEVTRELYQVSDRYHGKLTYAACDCGLNAALMRWRKAAHELRVVAGQAFDFKPQTRPGILAQALALYGAFETKDDRVGSKFAASLAVSVLEIEDSHGGMSAMMLGGEGV